MGEIVTAKTSTSQQVASPIDTKAAEQLPSADSVVIGRASVGSLCFDGNTLEASVHWLDESSTSTERKYDMFSLRIGTGYAFAVDLAEFRATYKKFANFLDWLFEIRDERLRHIMNLPDSDPSTVAKPMPAPRARDDELDLQAVNKQSGRANPQQIELDNQPLQQDPQPPNNNTAESKNVGRAERRTTKKRKRNGSDHGKNLASATKSISKKRNRLTAGRERS